MSFPSSAGFLTGRGRKRKVRGYLPQLQTAVRKQMIATAVDARWSSLVVGSVVDVAQEDDDLAVRVVAQAEIFAVPIRDRLAQLGQPVQREVAVEAVLAYSIPGGF